MLVSAAASSGSPPSRRSWSCPSCFGPSCRRMQRGCLGRCCVSAGWPGVTSIQGFVFRRLTIQPSVCSAIASLRETPERASATVLVGLDLQVARGPFLLAHGVVDTQRLEAANELREGATDFPRISLEGRADSQNGPYFLGLDPLRRANSGEPGRDHNPRVGGFESLLRHWRNTSNKRLTVSRVAHQPTPEARGVIVNFELQRPAR